MSNPFLKHHADQLVNLASTNALASEFIEDMPKSVAICNIAMGIASTTMSEEQMQPVLERVTEELKAVVTRCCAHRQSGVSDPRKPGRIRA